MDYFIYVLNETLSLLVPLKKYHVEILELN